jgi:hypothetical protein
LLLDKLAPLLPAHISTPTSLGHHPDVVVGQQARLRQAVHDLAHAVYGQWTKEAGLRSLHSPEPIRVSWSSLGQPVAADLSRVLAAEAVMGRPLRLRGDIRQAMEVFRRVRARQLIVIGEPAAGKSVLALLLTLDLLPDEPVPVLLPFSSWNPPREDLHAWVARRIVEEYPALANSDMYGNDAATRLIIEKRVMPVLDGLDEMAAALRPVAIKAIDRAVTNQYPLVVTCRTAEYRNAVEENGRFLAHAAVLEIQPVNIDDASDFLLGANPRAQHWQPLLDRLRAHPDEPLAQALRSPLMIDLARTVYAAGNPADLLDTARFRDQATIEHHLLQAYLLVAYEGRTVPPGPQPRSVATRYSAQRASEWLRFLADVPTAHGDHDIAWWRLVDSVPRPIRGLSVGLFAGLVIGLGDGYTISRTTGRAVGLVFGVAAVSAGIWGHARPPSRIEIRFRGNGRSLLRRLAASLVIALALVPVYGPVDGIAYIVVYLVIFTAQLWLNAPPDVTTAASLRDVLRQDRRAALTLGGALVVASGLIATASTVTAQVNTYPFDLPGWAAIGLTGFLTDTTIGAILGSFVFGRIGRCNIRNGRGRDRVVCIQDRRR